MEPVTCGTSIGAEAGGVYEYAADVRGERGLGKVLGMVGYGGTSHSQFAGCIDS